ncbi:SGNH/GDSL hydrolase family protein [Balneola sp. MJW-20]|uniref:SGNH/GDSL hydrolase family protein n=1 Tax=Gracilimonas aurantiaca TaxID=3234185 RepID=UPI003467EC14
MRYTQLFLLLTGLFIISCNSQDQPVSTESISFLALGDSYTIGTSVDSAGRWPVQLTDSLTKHGFNISDLKIVATNGWTTDELHSGLASDDLAPAYDLVSLLIGVNNQYRGYDIDIYRTEFRELLEHAIDYAGSDTSRVFVLSIPNYGVTPFARNRQPDKIRQELNNYNEIASVISAEYGIPFIDITPISELAAFDPSLLASDSLHPSAIMYSQWVSEALPVVKNMIENESDEQ